MTRPLLLVTNDDGIFAPGIAALAEALEPLGEVWVVAPETNQTAVSRAISLNRPLRARPDGERRFAIDGTPTDCTYLGILELLPEAPALVASGINRGNNLAEDTLYSGTVGAAIEGCMMGVPSFAVSLGYGGNLELAGKLARNLAEDILERGLPEGTLLNLNVPAHPAPDWRVHVAPLGRRDYKRTVERRLDPRGRPYYWLGGPNIGYVPGEGGTDCELIAQGQVTLSPLHPEITDRASLQMLNVWSTALLDHRSAEHRALPASHFEETSS